MGLGGGSDSSSSVLKSGSSTSDIGSPYFQNSNPLNPATVRMPNNFNFAQQQDPETYNAVQLQKQAQYQRLAKIDQAYAGDRTQISKAKDAPLKDEQIVQGIPEEERKGNRATYLYNEVLNGVGSIAAGLGDVLLQSNNNASMYNPNAPIDSKTTAEVEGEAQALKQYREEVAPGIRGFFTKNIGADLDKGLKSKYQNETFTAALGGLAQSAPAIAVTMASGGAGTGAMFLQSYDNALESINQSEEGRNLDDATKTYFAAGVGIATSALEKFGLDRIFKSETGIIGNLVAKQALKKATAETGGKVTGDVLTKFLDNEVLSLSNKYLTGGLKALDGALIEYGTEALQEGAQAGGELLVNKETGKPVFDTSETGNWKGFLKRMNKAGVMGAIGGGVLGSVAGLANLNKSNVEKTQKSLDEVNTALANENLSEASQKALIDNKIKLEKEIDKTSDKIDETFDKLDDNQKEKVLDIVDRKNEISQVIADPSVPESVKEKLAKEDEALDEELKSINPQEEAEKAPKEAIKETKTTEPIQTTTEIKESVQKPVNEESLDTKNELEDYISQAKEVAEQHEALAKQETDPVEKQEQLDIAKNARELIANSEKELTTIRGEEVITKAEKDLEALKQVTDKVKKYDASMKRLTDAKNNKEISITEFNDLKKRFDDVIGESTLKSKEETVVLLESNETIPDKESTLQDKVVAMQDKRQSIKDRISQKLKQQRGNLSSGFDPSLISDFIELGSTYVEEGIVKASEFIKRFREDYRDMGLDDKDITDEDIVDNIYNPNTKITDKNVNEISDDFKKLIHKNIQSDEVSSTLNNVERETGRELTEDEKEYRVTKRNDALNHGAEVVERAKEKFGKTYVSDLLNYLNDNASTLSLENRALINISLELDLERQLLDDPDNITLNKQLKLVRDASTKFQRSAAIATGYGILRQIARVGYDISQVTDQFFSEQQLADKANLNKAIEATPEDINREAEAQQQGIDISEDFNVTPKPRKKQFGLTEQQQQEKAELAKQFRGVFNDVTRIATLLADKNFMRYAKLVLLDTAGDFETFAKNMMESVGEGIKEHLPTIYKKVGGTDGVTEKTTAQKAKDKSIKDIVKKALIDKGYGRDITVTLNEKDTDGKKIKEKRTVLDWKKLAGEEGSVANIRDNVESALLEDGYSQNYINTIQNDLVTEYNRLHASIIEKSLNELQSRNKEREPIDVKTSAKKLAELYNYGLFEQEADTYDNIVNRALGLSEVGEKAFQEAKVLAKALSDLYRSTDANGRKISEFGLKEAIRSINGEIERLLTDVAWEQSNMAFKVATVTKEFMGLSQRAMLQTVKQILENPISGFIQRGFTKIGYSMDGTDTDALSKKRSEAAKIIYEDIVRNGGLNYGEIITPFVTRGAFEKKLDRMSDSKVYHTALSALLGRAYLDGADSMHKSALTERYFVHNLVRILIKKGMPKQDAIEFVSNQLTGQKFTDALGSAKQIIDKANEDAGKKIINDNPNAIYRLAQNIVKDALVVGENITLKEVESSYKAAYKAAGYDLGHEANNIVSETVSNATTKLENLIKQAVKEKKWNHATALTFTSILTKNIINPFVSGGTNWIVLSLQKAGVDIISPIVDYARQKENKLDLTTKEGVKNMENALLSEMRYKNTMNRVVIGGMSTLLVAAAAISTGADDDLAAWLKKNDWAKKYFKIISPQALILLVAQENKQVADYLISLFGFTYDSFSDTKKLTQAFQGLTSDKKKQQEKGTRKLGEVLGGHTSFPGPWRVAKDVENLYRGIEGKKPIKPDYNKGGFWDGYFRNGVVEYFMLER